MQSDQTRHDVGTPARREAHEHTHGLRGPRICGLREAVALPKMSGAASNRASRARRLIVVMWSSRSQSYAAGSAQCYGLESP